MAEEKIWEEGEQMKRSELRPCDNCNGPFKEGIFYVVRMSLAFIKQDAARQVLGLNMYFGGALNLAETMAPEPDAVVVGMDKESQMMTEVFLCQDCFIEPLNYAVLAEKLNARLSRD